MYKISKFESSGIIYEPSMDLLYVADDGGQVASLSRYGNIVRIEDIPPKKHIYGLIKKGPDIEGMATMGVGSGLIYAGIEYGKADYLDKYGIKRTSNKAQIWELSATTLKVTNRKWVLNMGSSINATYGMEGFTWIPNGEHPYGNRNSGGVFYASSQADGLIYVFDVDLTISPFSVNNILEPIATFRPDKNYNYIAKTVDTDIADLFYDQSQKLLYVLYDGKNKLVLIDTLTVAHKQIMSFNLPTYTRSDEGITVLPGCSSGRGTTTLYLTDDKGPGVFVYGGFPVFCRENLNKSQFVTQSVNAKMFTGARSRVSIRLQNVGNTVWKHGLYKLGPQPDNLTWGVSRVDLVNDVSPGQWADFTFYVKPPSKYGSYNFQWRMIQGNTWFGTLTTPVKVSVDGVISIHL